MKNHDLKHQNMNIYRGVPYKTKMQYLMIKYFNMNAKDIEKLKVKFLKVDHHINKYLHLYLGYSILSLCISHCTLEFMKRIYSTESESLPYKHAFLIKKKADSFKRGDYVFFRSGLVEGRLNRKVTGLPGDKITVSGQEVFVNGTSVGKATEKFVDGHPVHVIVPQTIPENCYFVSESSEKSFDSRYQEFGLLRQHMILGEITPLW